MNWMKKKPESEEVNYWQTISDVMSALLLVLLLVVLLMSLYILRTPDDEKEDAYPSPTISPTLAPGDSWHGYGGNDWNRPEQTREPERRYEEHSAGGGNGKDGKGDYEYPEIGFSEYEGMEKAAVYVIVLDAETRQQIRETNVRFDLTDQSGELQTLNVYYPRRITFKDYQTTDTGTFYLPEKIRLGAWNLRELSEPAGYDASENVQFIIDESHDWDEPYVINVELFPSRNVVQVQSADALTGEAVPGGIYEIVAAEDIITADGSLRCSEGDVVDRIICDEHGTGESKELYLGKYLIRQVTPPEYYAGIREPVNVSVRKKQQGTTKQSTVSIPCDRTRFMLTVYDELYHDLPVDGAEFTLIGSDGSEKSVSADSQGKVEISDLKQGATYQLKQTGTKAGYQIGKDEISFAVSKDGRIEEEAVGRQETVNRTHRVCIRVKDAVLQNDLTDYLINVYDPSGAQVKTWNAIGTAQVVDGLAPGDYRVSISGGGTVEMDITVKDTPEIQTYETLIWTSSSYTAVIGAGVLALSAIGAGAFALVRKRKKK